MVYNRPLSLTHQKSLVGLYVICMIARDVMMFYTQT